MPEGPLEQITSDEAAAIARLIEPHLDKYADMYDSKKYCPTDYAELRTTFETPAQVSRTDLERALRWKFGHRDKSRIPEAHVRLIADLGILWPAFVRSGLEDPEEMIEYLLEHLDRPHAFITVAFLVHLLCGERVPIVDQHNLRAVNWFMGRVRAGWKGKRKPDRIVDVWLVRSFLAAIPAEWPQWGTTAPTKTELDRFLMMYGKELKSGRRSVSPS